MINIQDITVRGYLVIEWNNHDVILAQTVEHGALNLRVMGFCHYHYHYASS